MADSQSGQDNRIPESAPPPQLLAAGAAVAAAKSTDDVSQTPQDEQTHHGQSQDTKPEASAYQGSYRPNESSQPLQSYAWHSFIVISRVKLTVLQIAQQLPLQLWILRQQRSPGSCSWRRTSHRKCTTASLQRDVWANSQ